MFHFGDVAVSHHPDTPPVPMVIPMVYLYPLPSHEQGNPLSMWIRVGHFGAMTKYVESSTFPADRQIGIDGFH